MLAIKKGKQRHGTYRVIYTELFIVLGLEHKWLKLIENDLATIILKLHKTIYNNLQQFRFAHW